MKFCAFVFLLASPLFTAYSAQLPASQNGASDSKPNTNQSDNDQKQKTSTPTVAPSKATSSQSNILASANTLNF